MHTHCELCGRQYWQDHRYPLSGDDRFCETCAIEACEQMQARRLTSVPADRLGTPHQTDSDDTAASAEHHR